MDGAALAEKLKRQLRTKIESMARRPGLAVVLVGDDPASRVYVNGKKKDCAQCGVYSQEYALPQETTQNQLLALIDQLNAQREIDGILLQLPLPKHLDERQLLQAIRPDKDVDCFHPFNMGQLMIGEDAFQPCTPAGVMRLLKEYGVSPAGKRCVIVGRSNIVGKPLAMLMTQSDATVTVCHSKTADLKEECLRADILVAAVGKTGLITGEMIKPGAVVIDVAINRDQDGKLCGDVVYEQAAQRACYITPVPGGVGPMTRAMLMENTLLAAKAHGAYH
jgi:methylenetetrahydrofolate dehydrogenase (NADP+)/methenyltetrahydrofolate cyclohydrolase